jgi:predicted LPLAT superfamily acyltransferase
MSRVASRHWAAIGESTFVAGIWLLWALHRVGGRSAFRVVMWPVAGFYWLAAADARAASLNYLRRVEAATGAIGHAPAWRDSLRHFASFGETILDKLLAVAGRYPSDRIRIDAPTLPNRGGVIVTAHVGCLELSRFVGESRSGLDLLVLVHTRHAERFNAVLRRLQPSARVELLQVSEVDPATAARLDAHVGRGGWLAIVGDRVALNSAQSARLPFLGAVAPFPVGAYVLAAMLHCPLYFMVCVRRGRGHRLVLRLLAERVVLPRASRQQALTEQAAAYARQLEAVLREAPFEWFNFFDFWGQPDALADRRAAQ